MIDLTRLPAPALIETLDFETILAGIKADLTARDPSLSATLQLESEPVVKVLEACAYRELLARARINAAARGSLLAFASGGTLDHLGALLGVARKEPVNGVGQTETDDAFRARIQGAFEGLSVAGPTGAYREMALTADPRVVSAAVTSPAPGEVQVAILSSEGDHSASAELRAMSLRS